MIDETTLFDIRESIEKLMISNRTVNPTIKSDYDKIEFARIYNHAIQDVLIMLRKKFDN